MSQRRDDRGNHALRTVASAVALLALPYATYVAATWYRYGRAGKQRQGIQEGSLLDRFMPTYEVAEHHEIDVAAPAALTMAAAREMDLYRSPVVHAIFAIRTLPSRFRGASPRAPASLLAETLSLGWRVLAEVPDRACVVGAVTQPWRAEVEFRGLAPEAFAGFAEPGYAKIAWTFEAIPAGPAASRFRTETRVSTTDPRSRALFRWYWAMLSPGILLIRRESLRLVKAEAERRCRASAHAGTAVLA